MNKRVNTDKKIPFPVYAQYINDKCMLDRIKKVYPEYQHKELVLLQKFTKQELKTKLPEITVKQLSSNKFDCEYLDNLPDAIFYDKKDGNMHTIKYASIVNNDYQQFISPESEFNLKYSGHIHTISILWLNAPPALRLSVASAMATMVTRSCQIDVRIEGGLLPVNAEALKSISQLHVEQAEYIDAFYSARVWGQITRFKKDETFAEIFIKYYEKF